MSLLSQVRGYIFLFRKPSRPASIKSLTAYFYKPFKWYSKGRGSYGIDERAPSTAKEFERVAEEKQKLQEAEQGIASQTADKFFDATKEAILGEPKTETVKKYKEHEAGTDYRRRENKD